MLTFGLSQRLSSLLFISIGVGILLSLSLPAAAAVSSPPLTELDMEEMSQIAGGGSVCKVVKTIPTEHLGRCRPEGSTCLHEAECGDGNYTIIYSTEYCANAQMGGHGCSCKPYGRAWKAFNCRRCTKAPWQPAGLCGKRKLNSYGGRRLDCDVGPDCGDI